MQWELLTPAEFKKLAREEQICILPIGSLERHGEHLPFGTDALTSHHLACKAAEMEPCVVFPPYWFGQVHEASCFAGAINFPSRLCLEMLETLCDQIAHNGFKKIVILNGQGGNINMLEYFAMSNLDRKVDYTLYIVRGVNINGRHVAELGDLWDTVPGHAGESETSFLMAVAPQAVRMDQQCFAEPIKPRGLMQPMLDAGATNGLWWYADYPKNVTESPSAATEEKGKRIMEARAKDLAELLKFIKEDTVVPALQKEFYDRVDHVKDLK